MKLMIEVNIKGFEMYHDLAENEEYQNCHINEHVYELIAGLGDWDSFRVNFKFDKEADDGKE